METLFISNATKTQERTKRSEKTVREREIVLFNDEVNTFDWVIDCLIEVCDHTPEQAEQSAMITHSRGKCGVKSGSFVELKPLCTNLLERGLSAEIM